MIKHPVDRQEIWYLYRQTIPTQGIVESSRVIAEYYPVFDIEHNKHCLLLDSELFTDKESAEEAAANLKEEDIVVCTTSHRKSAKQPSTGTPQAGRRKSTRQTRASSAN